MWMSGTTGRHMVTAMTRMLRHAVRTALVLGAAGVADASSYCNSRYSYCMTVPPALYGQGEADAGDGQTFLNRSATVSLTVWGAWSDLPGLPTFEVAYREASRGWAAAPGRPARVVTYKLFRPQFFVVSGLEGGQVFYQRTIRSATSPSMATYLLQYRDGDRTAAGYIKSLTANFRLTR